MLATLLKLESLAKGYEALYDKPLGDGVAAVAIIDICIKKLQDRFEMANKDWQRRHVPGRLGQSYPACHVVVLLPHWSCVGVVHVHGCCASTLLAQAQHK